MRPHSLAQGAPLCENRVSAAESLEKAKVLLGRQYISRDSLESSAPGRTKAQAEACSGYAG